MKKWLIPLTILIVGLATAGGVTAFALSGNGDTTPAPEDSGTPDSSGVCAPGVTDCVDTDVQASDDGEPDNGIAVGEPHPDTRDDDGKVDDGSTTQPPIRSDEGIDPDKCNLVHNLTACTEDELKAAGIEPDVSGSASGETPAVEPGDVAEDGMVVPIGTFDQDGGSGTTSGSGEAKDAPIADGCEGIAPPPVTPDKDNVAD
jgi:hypothetical protein